MKQQDIAALIGIVVFAGMVSFFLVATFVTPKDQKRSAEVVTKITSEFSLPDNKVFNTDAINPTRRIEIAPNENNQPFTQSLE